MEREFSIEGMEDREWLRVEESEDHESIQIIVDLGDALASISLDVYGWNALMKLSGKVNIHVPREGSDGANKQQSNTEGGNYENSSIRY